MEMEFRGVRYTRPDPEPRKCWWFFHHWTEWVEKLSPNPLGSGLVWLQFRECIRCGLEQTRTPQPNE